MPSLIIIVVLVVAFRVYTDRQICVQPHWVELVWSAFQRSDLVRTNPI